MPLILTADDEDRHPAADAWLCRLEVDQCDGGPCGDDPDCPCRQRLEEQTTWSA